jgi:hypothetical protein
MIPYADLALDAVTLAIAAVVAATLAWFSVGMAALVGEAARVRRRAEERAFDSARVDADDPGEALDACVDALVAELDGPTHSLLGRHGPHRRLYRNAAGRYFLVVQVEYFPRYLDARFPGLGLSPESRYHVSALPVAAGEAHRLLAGHPDARLREFGADEVRSYLIAP